MSYGTSDTTVISSTKTEARNLNAIDASAASRDDSSPATIPTTTPQNRHGSAAGMTETDITNRLVLARQRRLLNLQTLITQLEEELLVIEECAGSQLDDQDEVYLFKRKRQEFLIKTREELLSKPMDSFIISQGSLPITTPRRSANSSQNLTTFDYHFNDYSCHTTTPAQEQQKVIPRSASQADVNTTGPFGNAVNPLDNNKITNYKLYTSGKSYSGSSPTIIDDHIKPHCTGPTQTSMCVQQNNFITTRNLKIPKSLQYTTTLDHKRDTNINKFGSKPSKADLQVQLVCTNDSIYDQTKRNSDLCMNVSHNYVAPVHTTYELPNNVKIADVNVPVKRHPKKKLNSDTEKSKITISEEGENDVYDVPSDVKEENIANYNNTSTINGDDATEHLRRYRKHEAFRIKPDFHDVQLIAHPGDLKRCSGTSNTYRKNTICIAHLPYHSHTTPLRRNVCGLREKPTTWNNVFRYVMNEYLSKLYVAPDGKGYAYNCTNLLIRPSHCC